MQYTTFNKVDTYIELPGSPQTQAEINEYIDAVSQYMDKYVGYRIGAEPDELKDLLFDGSGTYSMPLGRYIRKTPETTVEDAESLTEAYFYPLNEEYSNMIKKDGYFTSKNAGVKITNVIPARYTVDWDTPENHNLPHDIEIVATILTVAIWRSTRQGANMTAEMGQGVTSEKIGDYTISYGGQNVAGASQLDADILKSYKILDYYKLRNIA